jgi:hypothetical protein
MGFLLSLKASSLNAARFHRASTFLVLMDRKAKAEINVLTFPHHDIIVRALDCAQTIQATRRQ